MPWILGTDKYGKCCNRCGKRTSEGVLIPPCDVECSSSSSGSGSSSSSHYTYIYGCMDNAACNYNSLANIDPGVLCIYCSPTQYCFAGVCIDCACAATCPTCPGTPCCDAGSTLNNVTCECVPAPYGGCVDWVGTPPAGFDSCLNTCVAFPVTFNDNGCCNCT